MTREPEPFRRLELAAAARTPLLEPQRRWLVALPSAAVVLDLFGGLLPYVALAVVTVVFVIGSWTITLGVAARCMLAAEAGARTRAERAEQEVPPGLVGRLIALWLLGLVPASAVLSGAAPGLVPALLATALMAALTPATLTLARRVSLPDALDPLNWRDILAEIGRGTGAGLAVVLFSLSAGYMALALLPLHGRLDWLGKGALMAYWVWATVAWFELAGRVLHGPVKEIEEIDPQREDLNSSFERLIRRGGSRQAHRRLADALLMAGDSERLREHGRVHVNALLAGFDRPREAVETAAGLLDRDPLFSLGDTESMYRLIRASRRHGFPRLTIRLCGNYLEAFPRSFKRDEVRLLACEAAAEGDRDARRVTAEWLHELIDARLAPDQRARLKRIVAVFHAEGLVRRPGT